MNGNKISVDSITDIKDAVLCTGSPPDLDSLKGCQIKALKIAEFLSDKSIVPILKIGLKDMDSDIVKVSAKLIQKFK